MFFIGKILSYSYWCFSCLELYIFVLILYLFRKLYIADARPRKNAFANGAMGGGSESSSNYFQSEVCFRFSLFSHVSPSAVFWHHGFANSCSFCVILHQIVFFGIDNIHAMRDSLARLRDYLDTHGTTSSDGMSSFLVSIDMLWRSVDLSVQTVFFFLRELIIYVGIFYNVLGIADESYSSWSE